ncbi:acylphosphatase [Candidatus Woesearchaeota archaeon]|nr:acylphosphatase [Candidatus Woesearchaeota archaeon]
MAKQCLRIIIAGEVQGVSFRYYARQQAKALGITGFVQNSPDGSVEIVAEGETKALQKFLAWCKKGPPKAIVNKVRVTEKPFQGIFSTFIMRT